MDTRLARVDGAGQMSHHLRVSCSFVVVVALAGILSCSSSSSTRHAADDGGAGGEPGRDDQPSQAGEVSEVGGTGQAGESAAGGAVGGGDAQVQRGVIALTQATARSEALMLDTANYSLTAIFATHAELAREQAAATVTTVGDCTASVVVIDPTAPRVSPRSFLAAGTLTVPVFLLPPSLVVASTAHRAAGVTNYSHAEGQTRFYEDADVITVRGAGGADLPAFKVESIKAPSEIAVTAPSCVTGSCPDVDHREDLLFTWENGGDGKVGVLFETVADTKVVLLECRFDASKGQGTISKSLLAKLDVVDGENVSGIEQITPINEVTFLVGDVTTTFSVRSAQYESLLTPAP